MSAPTVAATQSDVARVLAGELRYSHVWEDHLLLESALAIGKDDEVLLIASAGCNVLNLLLHGPRRIVAIDFNLAQTALVQLKLAGIRALDRDGLLELLGITRGDSLARYETVRPLLPVEVRAWWDANEAILSAGVDRAGRLDRFIVDFQRKHLARIHPPAVIDQLFALQTRAARQRFAETELFTPQFEAAFRAYYTRDAIAGRGRHPVQFGYVEETNVAEWFLGRLRWACTELPTRGNLYLERFLRGGTAEAEWLPPYLAADTYDRLRKLVSRVEVVTGDLESYLASGGGRTLTKAGLSDVFEYMAPDAADAAFEMLAAALRPRGRIAYWNLLVARESPDWLRGRLRPLGRLSRSLWRQDRAWFYRAFHVEEVQA